LPRCRTISRIVGALLLADTVGLDEAIARDALRSLTERGVLVETAEVDERDYEPRIPGWSTA
jgi:ribosomal protein S25